VLVSLQPCDTPGAGGGDAVFLHPQDVINEARTHMMLDAPHYTALCDKRNRYQQRLAYVRRRFLLCSWSWVFELCFVVVVVVASRLFQSRDSETRLQSNDLCKAQMIWSKLDCN
jgi:hypothetical protein